MVKFGGLGGGVVDGRGIIEGCLYTCTSVGKSTSNSTCTQIGNKLWIFIVLVRAKLLD